MLTYINRGPVITVKDPLRPGQYKQFRNPDWNEMPEIVSFTQFLIWNYLTEYGQYIRQLHTIGQLPLPWYIDSDAKITNVSIRDGKYDRIDEFSFYMYIICDVAFFRNGYSYQQSYCVHGYCNITGSSNFLYDVDLYNGKTIRLKNPLDEFLVPILPKKKYDEIAEQILEDYYPFSYDFPCIIDGLILASQMGYSVQYARLSLNESIKSKVIFEAKDVTVFDKNGNKTILFVPRKTILVDESLKDKENTAVIHECVHISLHRLFYHLQSHYRNAVGKAAPEFQDYFYSDSQRECVAWMETQTNSIARHIQMPVDSTTDAIINYLDRFGENPSFEEYRALIDHIAHTFDVSRYAAKKRIIELGWPEVRGVYVYCTVGYVEDYKVAYHFPMDSTYTLPLRRIAEIFGESDDFQALVKSRKYVYVDGHMCLNDEKYVITEYGVVFGLTEYAKYHMDECCIDFKKVYGKLTYSYTFGELNKEELAIIENYILTQQQKQDLKARLTEITHTKKKLDSIRTVSPLGEAVVYHMKRCNITSEELMERSGLGSTTITKLRTGKGRPKLETILAFCVALNLEEVFRTDLMNKAGVRFDNNNQAHIVYQIILELMPDANVFQINDFLKEEGFTPWTQDRQGTIAAAI